MPSIHRLITAGEYDEVREKLESDENDILFSSCYPNRHGATPFLLACAKDDIPQDIIRAILVIDDDNLNSRLKDNNATALHLACETGSAATVRTILSLVSEEASRDYTLLEDNNGWIALHVTWSRHLDPDEESYLGSELDMPESPSEFLRKLGRLKSPRDLMGKLKDTWDKTIMLLYTGTTGSFCSPVANGGQWNVTHSIAAAGGVDICNCPSIVLWLALKFFPEQVGWRDEDGNLPLHIMASGEDLYRIEASETDEMDDEAKLIYDFTLEDPIEMLLRCHPDAAKLPNKEGRLPLHIQCASDTEMSARISELFLKAAPKSVDTRDPITGLYPFMLAAVDIEEEDDDDDGTELDAVFILLRENPENVQGGIFMTEYETYLESKNAILEKQRLKHVAMIAELESRLNNKRKHDDLE